MKGTINRAVLFDKVNDPISQTKPLRHNIKEKVFVVWLLILFCHATTHNKYNLHH